MNFSKLTRIITENSKIISIKKPSEKNSLTSFYEISIEYY